MSLWLDSPYQISKIIGEYYSNYYFTRHGLPTVKARFQNVYGPGEMLGRRPLARHGEHGLAQRRADVHLQGAPPRGAAGRERRHRHARLHLRRGHGAGPDRLRDARRAGRGLQPRERRRDLDPRARRADQRADRQPDADRAHAGARLGPLGPALRRHRQGARASSASPPMSSCARASSARSPGRARTSTGSSAASPSTASGSQALQAALTMEAGSSRTGARDRAAAAASRCRACASSGSTATCCTSSRGARCRSATSSRRSASLWAVLQPLLLAVVFSVFFGHLAKMPSEPGVPYPAFAVSGMVLWLFFAGAMSACVREHGRQPRADLEGLLPARDHPARRRRRAAGRLLRSRSSSCWSTLVVYGITPPIQILLIPLRRRCSR